MSKFIPNKEHYKGQAKPKLKVKVVMNDEEAYLNEYDAFQMISELKQQMQQAFQALQGITDAMQAATAGMTSEAYREAGAGNVKMAADPNAIKLPKLSKPGEVKAEKSSLDSGTRFYGSDGEVNITQ